MSGSAMLRTLVGCMIAVFGVQMADAGDFTYHDDFNDGDVSGSTGGGHWVQGLIPAGATMDASSGDLVFNTTPQKSCTTWLPAKLASARSLLLFV